MSQTLKVRTRVLLAVAGLLAAHFILAVASKLHESVTSDELAHVTAGTAYWELNDYRLQPENGNLPQRLAGLPAWISGARFPPLTEPAWAASQVWAMGYSFFYLSGQDHFPMLMSARTIIALFSVGTGLLVFCWSRSLFGTRGGLVSLVFFAFCPNFLAHGALATSDACLVFFMLASAGAWWKHLNDRRPAIALLSMAVFGLACVAKFSAVLLLPMMAIMGIVRLLSPKPLEWGRARLESRPAKTAALLGSAAAHAAAALLIIWAFYGFRFSAFNPALPPAIHFILPWDVIDKEIGVQGRFIRLIEHWRLLPQGFLYGAAYVIDTARLRAAFLNGEFSNTGWVSFFPWAFLLKTTLPLMLAILAALGLALRRWVKLKAPLAADLYRTTPLIVLFVVYWVFSLTSKLDIGHRHILPAYPELFILAGALGAWLAPRRWPWAVAICCLMAWQVAEATATYPHYIAYFNELGGGPDKGRDHLVDSSLDWGQDLPGLRKWLDENARPDEQVYLSYFGSGEPDYYGIRSIHLNFLNLFGKQEPFVRLKPGLYCISATILSQVYSPVRGPWTQAFEDKYQLLRGYESLFEVYNYVPASRPEMNRQLPSEKWKDGWETFGVMRMARLCGYLRARRPDAQIGHSILIYRLGADEIREATQGTLQEWNSLIERTQERQSQGR